MSKSPHEQIQLELEALQTDMDRIRPRDGIKPKIFLNFVSRLKSISAQHRAAHHQPEKV